jgi:CheY-like chemotaxis protein
VELQGGNIRVRSTVGKGTTFTFELPFEIGKTEDLRTSGSAPVSQTATPPQNLAVLLVEDNPFNQMVATDTLNDLFPKISIDVASNGAEAVEKISGNEYDLVLMDIQMPVMDGFEATRRIRNELPSPKSGIKIMAMTANVTQDEVAKCFESGMNEFIAKPFQPEDLHRKIIRLVS